MSSSNRLSGETIDRYQRCVLRILEMFDSDPLPSECEAHFLVEKLEALLDLGLLTTAEAEAVTS